MLQQLGSAALQIGRLATVKGTATWDYFSTSAATPSSAGGYTSEGQVGPLYIVQEKVTQQTQSLPDYPVGSIRWRVTAPLGTDVDEGGVIRSTVDSTLIFTLGPLSSEQGWLDGVAKETKGLTLPS